MTDLIVARPKVAPTRALKSAMAALAIPYEEYPASTRYPGNGDDDPGFVMSPQFVAPFRPVPEVVTEAQRLLDEAARLAHDLVDLETLMEWFGALNHAVEVQLTAEGSATRMKAVCFAFGDYPRAVFTQESLRAAMRQFTFFPGVAKLCVFLDPIRDELVAHFQDLHRVASYVRPQPKPKAVPEEPDFTEDDMPTLMRTWNEVAEAFGLEPVERSGVSPEAMTGLPIIIKRHGRVSWAIALMHIAEHPFFREHFNSRSLMTFNWLASNPAQFARMLIKPEPSPRAAPGRR